MPGWIGGLIPIVMGSAAPSPPMDWHQPWATPVRYPAYEVVSNVRSFPAVVGPQENRWFQHWSVPVRYPAYEVASNIRSFGVPPDNGTLDKWHQPFAVPVRDQAYEVSSDNVNFVVPAPVTEDEWHQPWSMPTRRKTTPANQQALAWSGFTPATENIYEDKWHQPWSEPVRRKVVIQQVDLNVFVVTAETIYEDKWHQPWSDPTRRKSTPANQQALAWSGFTPAPAFTVDMWYQAWTDPVRTKAALRPALQQPQAFVSKPVVSFGWFGELGRPRTLVKPWLAAAGQLQPVLTPIVVKYEWHQPLSVPTRRKTSSAFQQSLGWVPLVVRISEDQWHQPWSVPTRRPTTPANQQALAWSGFTPAEIVTRDKWYQFWAEPVRQKRGLGAPWQPFRTSPIVIYDITGILAAIETPDTALFGGRAFHRPFDALVGIVEKAPPGAYQGIIEKPVKGIVSIREI